MPFSNYLSLLVGLNAVQEDPLSPTRNSQDTARHASWLSESIGKVTQKMVDINATSHENNVEDGRLLSKLKDNSFYILLYHHTDPGIKYHWGLYHHVNATSGGWKFDITDAGGPWHLAIPYQIMPQNDVLPHPNPVEPLACVVRIGNVGEETVKNGSYPNYDFFHNLIRLDDDRLNDLNIDLGGKLSCKVYVQRACQRLKQRKLLTFNAWSDVECEVLCLGDRNGAQRKLGAREAIAVDSNAVGF